MTDGTPILFYDGACALCNRTVQFLLRHDRHATLRFAALGSHFAKGFLAGKPELRDLDSLLWIDAATGRVFAKSAAGLRVAAYLGGLWRLALLLWLMPRPIRDWGYDLIARHRHLLTGRTAHCLIAPPGTEQRFLDARQAATDA